MSRNPTEIKSTGSVNGPTADLSPSVPSVIEGSHAPASRVIPSASRPIQSTGPDATVLLKAFQRRWRLRLGLPSWVRASSPPESGFSSSRKVYRRSLLLVEPVQPKVIAATNEYWSDPLTDRSTQVTLIKSPVVLGKALSQPEVTQLEMVRRLLEPSEWLESEIKAEFTGKILRLTLSGDKPSEVATLVKSVTNAYLSEVVNKEKLARIERNDLLKKTTTNSSDSSKRGEVASEP